MEKDNHDPPEKANLSESEKRLIHLLRGDLGMQVQTSIRGSAVHTQTISRIINL